MDPGGSIVTSSTSVASTRSGSAAGRAAAAAAASASTAGGNPSGRPNSARTAPKSGPLTSHDGSAGGRFPSAVRRSRPFDRPSSHATSSAAGPRTSSGPPSDPAGISPTVHVRGSSVGASSSRGNSGRAPIVTAASVRSSRSIGRGRSLNEAPASRSMAWIHTSRARSHSTSEARIRRPRKSTRADQASSGIPRTAAASRSDDATRSARISAGERLAPASMSALRCSVLL